jgi:hypothetical protein
VPWAVQRPVALIFDEYDAGRADVMFVIQRILERDGRFTLLDQNRVLTPHASFRLFATSNTVGLGGLGLELSPFYPHWLAADVTQGLDNGLFGEIGRFFGSRPGRGSPRPARR